MLWETTDLNRGFAAPPNLSPLAPLQFLQYVPTCLCVSDGREGGASVACIAAREAAHLGQETLGKIRASHARMFLGDDTQRSYCGASLFDAEACFRCEQCPSLGIYLHMLLLPLPSSCTWKVARYTGRCECRVVTAATLFPFPCRTFNWAYCCILRRSAVNGIHQKYGEKSEQVVKQNQLKQTLG